MNIMKNFKFLSRVMAVLCTAMLLLPQNAIAQNIDHAEKNWGPYAIGQEIILPMGLNTRTMYLDPSDVISITSDENDPPVKMYTKDIGFDPSYTYYGYQIGTLHAVAPGVSTITANECKLHPQTNELVEIIEWVLHLTVSSDKYVEAGVLNGNDGADPSVLKDTTMEIGTYINNWVGLYYVSDVWSYEYQGDTVFERSWNTIYSYDGDIIVTSDDPTVVEVDGLSLYARKRGETTINVSCEAKDGHIARTVSYKVKVNGEDKDIFFYHNGERLEEFTINRHIDGTQDYDPENDEIRVYLDQGFGVVGPCTEYFVVSSDNIGVVTIKDCFSNFVEFEFKGYGTATIAVIFPGNDYWNRAEASFTLTYVDPDAVDMYFVDGNTGERITTLNVARDNNGYPDFGGVSPEVRFEKDGMLLNLDMTVTSEDENIVRVYDATSPYLSLTCYELGTTNIVATFAGSAYYSPATAKLKVAYRQGVNMYFTDDQDHYIASEEYTEDMCNLINRHTLYYKVVMQSSADFSTLDFPIIVTSSDASIIKVFYTSPSSTREIGFLLTDGYGTANIVAKFTGNDTYSPATITLPVTINRYPGGTPTLHLEDEEGTVYTQYEVTEGDTIPWPDFRMEDHSISECMHLVNTHGGFEVDHYYWLLNKEKRSWDRIYALRAGDDVVVTEYWRVDRDGVESEHKTLEIPLHFLPLITPASSEDETTLNLDPESSLNTSFSAGEGDSFTKNRIVITSLPTPENIQLALDSFAAGSDKWKELLPGSLTFNVEGTGVVYIECETQSDYELKAVLRDTTLGITTIKHEAMASEAVHYNVKEPTAMLIYAAASESPSPAPERREQNAPRDEQAYKAIIKSIVVSPQAEEPTVPTSINEAGNATIDSSEIIKCINNGQLIIIRNGNRYNAQGQIVK